MNLLHIVHYPVFGGPHNQALRLAGPLEAAGWRTTVLLPDEPGNAAERLSAGGVDVVSIPLGRLRATPRPKVLGRYVAGLRRDIANIRRIIEERDIDLVVLAGHVNIQGAFAARQAGVPVVWQVLDTRTPAPLDEALLRLSRRYADVVMTTGEIIAERHKRRLGHDQLIVPFYPPVDCAAFRPRPDERRSVRGEWGIDECDLVLGAVGNINPQKGIDQLVEAFAALRRMGDKARLVLVGAEYDTHRVYSADLRAQMTRHGLVEGRDVVFTGARSDVARQLQGFDVFVMGSVPNSEGVPTVILEAMASGHPVVATNVGGVSEVVRQGETGYVVPALMPEALAANASRLLRDPALRTRMSLAARDHAVARFDVAVCAETHLQAFEAALARRGRFIAGRREAARAA